MRVQRSRCDFLDPRQRDTRGCLISFLHDEQHLNSGRIPLRLAACRGDVAVSVARKTRFGEIQKN
jgi:hypothetical protein